MAACSATGSLRRPTFPKSKARPARDRGPPVVCLVRVTLRPQPSVQPDLPPRSLRHAPGPRPVGSHMNRPPLPGASSAYATATAAESGNTGILRWQMRPHRTHTSGGVYGLTRTPYRSAEPCSAAVRGRGGKGGGMWWPARATHPTALSSPPLHRLLAWDISRRSTVAMRPPNLPSDRSPQSGRRAPYECRC